MLDVLTEGLGPFTLEYLAGDPVHIERWLNRMQKERNWSPNTWNPEKYRVGTKGALMRLRLMMALDTGVRREEMMSIQLKHINFRPVLTTIEGEQWELFAVEVQSKGEKTTGEKEFVWVGTERLKEALKKRRFALRNDQEAYVFGTETGKHQKAFRRMWREAFTLAGVEYG